MGVETHVTGFNDPITVRYMFEHVDGYQIGERHSKDAWRRLWQTDCGGACGDVRPAFFLRCGTGLVPPASVRSHSTAVAAVRSLGLKSARLGCSIIFANHYMPSLRIVTASLCFKAESADGGGEPRDG